MNEFGQIAYDEWAKLHERFLNFELDVYVKKYKFPLKAKQKFAQYSPVTFMPMLSKK